MRLARTGQNILRLLPDRRPDVAERVCELVRRDELDENQNNLAEVQEENDGTIPLDAARRRRCFVLRFRVRMDGRSTVVSQ